MEKRLTNLHLEPYFIDRNNKEYKYNDNDPRQKDFIDYTLKKLLKDDAIATDHGDGQVYVLMDENININEKTIENIKIRVYDLLYANNPEIPRADYYLQFRIISIDNYTQGGKYKRKSIRRKTRRRRRTIKKSRRKQRKSYKKRKT